MKLANLTKISIQGLLNYTFMQTFSIVLEHQNGSRAYAIYKILTEYNKRAIGQ